MLGKVSAIANGAMLVYGTFRYTPVELDKVFNSVKLPAKAPTIVPTGPAKLPRAAPAAPPPTPAAMVNVVSIKFLAHRLPEISPLYHCRIFLMASYVSCRAHSATRATVPPT